MFGNKGCHSSNGNMKRFKPDDDKNQVNLDEKTRELIKSRVHESVGHITMPDCTGTGFAVGGNNLMSAYHVFREQILDLINHIINGILQSTKVDVKGTIEKLEKSLNVTMVTGKEEEKDFNKILQHLMRTFLADHGTNVKLLLKKMECVIQKERIEAIRDSLSDGWRNCRVEFTEERKFFVDWDIKFGSEEHDIIIVELKNEYPEEVLFPSPLLIDYEHRPEENIQIIQYLLNNNEFIFSTNCELFNDFPGKREECIQWWQTCDGRKNYDPNMEIDIERCFHEDCPVQYDKTTGVLITQASRSFTEGSSGSPMTYWSSTLGLPVVTSVFQGGLPKFYYRKVEKGGKFPRDNPDDEICGRHLFEKGLSMKKVAELLDNYRRDDLKEEIFGPLKQAEGNCYGRREREDSMLRTEEAWEKEDNNCFVTKGVKATFEKIQSDTCNCVCVTGDPGSGKSMSIRHAALQLKRKKGFTVYPISSPKDFFKFLDEKKSQVFVIDDILGIHSVYKDLMSQWSRHHDVIKCLLSSRTKILASLRTHLVKHQNVRLEDFVFLEKSKRVDFYDKRYRLDEEEMKNMLRMLLNRSNVAKAEQIVEKICWNSGLPILDSFPLLCKMFCKEEKFRREPNKFFSDPFPALIKSFKNMRKENRPLFCGLVLCVAFDGKLSGDYLSAYAQFSGQLDDKIEDLVLRDKLVRSLRLDPRSDLDSVKSALKASDGVYVISKGNDFEIYHRIFHDIVTFVLDDKYFLFSYGTSQFIKDRVRLKKRPEDDQFVVVCGGDTNIDRLATRLTDDFKYDMKMLTDLKSDMKLLTDLKSDQDIEMRKHRLMDDIKGDLKRKPLMGSSFIVENCNIDDSRLIDRLRKANFDRKAVRILFRECFSVIHENSKHLKQSSDCESEIPQLKLIGLLLKLGADCNMDMDIPWPLHIAINAGSLQLTRLLLENGADIRICNWHCWSALHLTCFAKYNNLSLARILIDKGIDEVPAVRVLGIGKREISKWFVLTRPKQSLATDDSDMQMTETKEKSSLQLEEVSPNGFRNVLANNQNRIENIVENYTGNHTLQLVEILDKSCLNVANETDGQNILHLAVRYRGASFVETLLGLGSKLTCKNDEDYEGMTPERLIDEDIVIPDRRPKMELFSH